MTLHNRNDRVVGGLCWYPPAWRARYGAEFADVLKSLRVDQPRSLRRAINVAFTGLRTRSEYAGLTGTVVSPDIGTRTGIALATVGALGFLVTVIRTLFLMTAFDAPTNHQLSRIGLAPLLPATFTRDALLGCAAIIAVVAVFTSIHRVVQLKSAAVPLHRRLVRRPLLTLLGSMSVLVGASYGFLHDAPHTQSVTAQQVVAASTLPLSALWRVPSTSTFPEILWLVVSFVAMASVLGSGYQLLRAIPHCASTIRTQTRSGVITAISMFAAYVLCCSWSLGFAAHVNVVGPVGSAGTGRLTALTWMTLFGLLFWAGTVRVHRSIRRVQAA